MNLISFLKDIVHQPFFICLLAIAACTCFYFLKIKSKIPGKIAGIIFIVAISIFAGGIIFRLTHPQIWDFSAFYLYGKVGASGTDYYLPENFHTVFKTLQLPDLDYAGFTGEIVDAGFLYPPPTILLFTPLGFLPYYTAEICWLSFNLLFAAGSIYLLFNLFLKEYKTWGLIFAATLFFLLQPVRATVFYMQTNFILLFLLLLMHKYADKKFAGIILAFAFFTKPYMIVFALFFLLRKQWKTLIYFAVTTIIFTAITFFIFGKSPFISYIYNNPTKRLPKAVFFEDNNQSLHAVLLRSNIITLDKPEVYFYITGGIFLLSAVYILFLLRRKLYDYIWAVLLLVGLLVYPGTLNYYGVLLLFIIFQFFNTKNQLGFNMYITIPAVAIFYFLSSVSVFSCVCFLLLIIIIKSIIDYRSALNKNSKA